MFVPPKAATHSTESRVGQSSQQKLLGAACLPLRLSGTGRLPLRLTVLSLALASLRNDLRACASCESQDKPFLCPSHSVWFPLTRVIS